MDQGWCIRIDVQQKYWAQSSQEKGKTLKVPVEVSRYQFVASTEPVAENDYATHQPKIDAQSGQPIYATQVVALGPDGAEVIKIRTVGKPLGIVAGGSVRIVGLWASTWQSSDKAGISFRAERIEPVQTKS